MARTTRRRVAAAITLTSAAIAMAGCSAGGTSATSPGSATYVSAGIKPEHIVEAPKNILASAMPQPNGTMWVLAGSTKSRGLFELDPTSGKVFGSISVSSGRAIRSTGCDGGDRPGVRDGQSRGAGVAGRPDREGHPDRTAVCARPRGGGRK